MSKIHPTAIVDPAAQIAPDVVIGAYCVIESDVSIGPGCLLHEFVVVRRYSTLGAGNVLHPGVVIGGDPQDLKFDRANVSYVRIGDGNTFREAVTINRATGDGLATVIGNNTYWMACSHAGHNTQVGDNTIFVNGALLGGFARVGDRAVISGNVGVHQFTAVGDLAMIQGGSLVLKHLPPYVMQADSREVVGLNRIGLRRAEYITVEDRKQIREAFDITYRSGRSYAEAVEVMKACTDWGPAAAKFRDFIAWAITAAKPYNRGLVPAPRRGKGSDESSELD